MIAPPPAIIAAAPAPGPLPTIAPELATALFKRAKVARGVIIIGRVLGTDANVQVLSTEGAPRADDHTLFAIDGLTETITALLLADAVHRGEVRLDEPVADLHDADLHPPARGAAPVTLVDLATHHVDFPDVPFSQAEQPYAGIDRAALVRLVNAARSTPAGAATYTPSVLDYAALGTLLADRAGTSFASLARERVFVPLEMNDTVADTGSDARVIAGRTIANVPATPWRYNALAPAGGVRSSVIDLMRFASAMFTGDNGALAPAMTLAGTPRAAAANARIGLAWRTQGDTGHVWASGGSYGSTAFLAISPKDHAAVVILSNVGIGFGDATFDDLGLRVLADTVRGRTP